MTTSEPTTLDTALTFIPILPGFLSILGASAILYNILSDPDRRFTTPYYRIMFVLSTADITYSIAKMCSTFAAPKDTPGLYFAAGNQATCTAQGFFLQLGMIQAAYTTSLSINYLMVIKYGKSDEYLSRYLEPWMHIISLGYPFVGAICMASLGYFNPNPNGCFIGPYPMDCYMTSDQSCIRGHHYYLMSWIFTGSVVCTSVVVMSSCMALVVLYVRNRFIVMRHRFSFADRAISSCTNLHKQYIAARKQALLYVGTFLLVWFFGFLFRVGPKTRNPYFLIPAQVFNPMQGFFNFFIYTWPRYEKSKEEYPDGSFWWLVKDSVVTTVKTKELRRRQSDAKRRTMRKRMSIMRRREGRQQRRVSGKVADELNDASFTSARVLEDPIATLQHLQTLDITYDSEVGELTNRGEERANLMLDCVFSEDSDDKFRNERAH